MSRLERNQYLLIRLNNKIVGIVAVEAGNKAEDYLSDYPNLIRHSKNIVTLDPRTNEYSIVPLNIGVISIHRFPNEKNLGIEELSVIYDDLVKTTKIRRK